MSLYVCADRDQQEFLRTKCFQFQDFEGEENKPIFSNSFKLSSATLVRTRALKDQE